MDNYLEELKTALTEIKVNKNIINEIDAFERSDLDSLLKKSGSAGNEIVDFIKKSEKYKDKMTEKYGKYQLDDKDKIEASKSIKQDVLRLGITKEKQIIIILGLPGSGKSSALKLIEKDYNNRFYLVDSDEFKYGLKNVNGEQITNSLTKKELKGVDVEYIHKASSQLAKFILELLLISGYDISLPKVGEDYEAMFTLINDINEKGYTIHLHFVYTTVETALKRNVERFKYALENNEKIRLVPPRDIYDMGYKPLLTFIKLLDNSKIKDHTLWDGEHYSSPCIVYKKGY